MDMSSLVSSQKTFLKFSIHSTCLLLFLHLNYVSRNCKAICLEPRPVPRGTLPRRNARSELCFRRDVDVDNLHANLECKYWSKNVDYMSLFTVTHEMLIIIL